MEYTEVDVKFMKMAFQEAMKAFDQDEVPIGCVITCNNQIIAKGHNLTERLRDFTAHAEMQAFTSASEYLGGKSLQDCTLYVTLEPCVMCAGAAYNTRISKIIFAAYDEKRGFTKFGHHQDSGQGIIHPKCEVFGGLMAEDSITLLRTFFEQKRR